MEHAVSILQIKSISDEPGQVVIEGIASTPTPDRAGDIVEPLGGLFKLPLPLLMSHDHTAPVGQVVAATKTSKGISFRAVLPIIKTAGVVKNRVDEAIDSLRAGLLRGVSVGFRAARDGAERMPNGSTRWKSWEWVELSLCSIPCNTEATVAVIRSIDTAARSKAVALTHSPTTPRLVSVSTTTSKGSAMSSVSFAPKGLAFGRFCKALILGNGSLYAAQAVAEGAAWNDTPQVLNGLKAAVGAVTSADVPNAMRPITVDFAEYLRPQTIVGRVQGFRRTPFDVRMIRGTDGTTAGFIGEGQATPVSAAAFESTLTLPRRKVGTIAIVTQELVRSSEPSAELVIAQDIAGAIAYAIDRAFIDVANVGVPDVKPASVTSTGFVLASTGSTLPEIDADLRALIANFNTEKIGLTAPIWIMSPTTALKLAMLGSGGYAAYPGVAIRGGTLLSIPIVVSAAASGQITLMDASEINLADDGDAEFSASEEALVQMDSAPDNPTAASSLMTSLWQQNLVGIRGLRFMNWSPRRVKAVGTITGVAY